MDSVEVKLPISGKTVVIRNYTTRADDAAAEAALGANAFRDASGDTKLPAINFLNHGHSYVYRLVQSIDGNTENLRGLIDQLKTPDYQALKSATEKVVEGNSPKVTPDNPDSSSSTTQN